MRKVTSSAFILILLLLSLWGLSTWFFANKNKTIIQHFLTESMPELTQNIVYQTLSIKHSILNTKAKYSINNSSDIFFTDIWSSLDNQLLIDLDIFNGPLLFDKTGIALGNSSWRISLDKSNQGLLNNLKLKQLPEAVIKSSFDENIIYELPIESFLGNVKITGIYYPDSKKGSGEIHIDNFLFKDKKHSMKANQVSLKFKHHSNASEQFQINLSSDIPEFLYQHKLMAKHVNLNLSGSSKILINDNKLKVSSDIDIKQEKTTHYPMDESHLSLQITDLNLDKLSDVIDKIGQLDNLAAQKQWILEEQGEVPEGQDQIWQKQDDFEQIVAKLPLLMEQLLVQDDKALSNFTVSTQYENKESSLLGSILPMSEHASDTASSNLSVLSYIQATADVKLDNTLLEFIAGQLPIKNNEFKLTYKDNSLLVQ